MDLLLLTKCGYFIGRKYSNFSNAAMLLGNMKFENIRGLPLNFMNQVFLNSYKLSGDFQ
jgi:hypothetical protein